MSSIAAVIGRILIAILFIVSGATKLVNVAPTEAMITGVGLPPGLAIPTGVFEIVAGLCLAVGLLTRIAPLLLAGFTFLAIIFYHNQFGDPKQLPIILGHFALIGGLLLVFAHSQLWWSWDAMHRTRKGEIATREAEARAHEAELRAARAEGAVQALNTDGTPVVTTPAAGVATSRRRWFH